MQRSFEFSSVWFIEVLNTQRGSEKRLLPMHVTARVFDPLLAFQSLG
jgi:hypothetical protein